MAILRWVQITNDPSTWPKDDKPVLVMDKLGISWEQPLLPHNEDDINMFSGLYWFPAWSERQEEKP